MGKARHEVFRTAREYFGAAARYWRATIDGRDLETPTQELIGCSLFYTAALKRAGREPYAKRRLRAVAAQLELTSRRYRQHHDVQ